MYKSERRILNRDTEDSTLQKLNYLSEGLSEAVNFGTHILAWDFERCKDDAYLPAIIFLRNFLDNIDAVTTLIKSSVVDPCYILLRAAFENLVSFEYLFESGEKETDRAMGFMVWSQETNLKLMKKSDDRTSYYQVLKEKSQHDKVLKGKVPLIRKNADSDYLLSNQIYKSPKYKLAKEEFDRISSKKKYTNWYQLYDGPKNLKELAERAGYPALYEAYYEIWSMSTHGNPIVQSKIAEDPDGYAIIIPLRRYDHASVVTQYCLNLCAAAFQSYVKKRLPDKFIYFSDWCSAMRSFNLSLRT
ncbi:MAG: DUF5677 domain-containing protein [Niabella sp.]